ncbi:hypothetical protein CTA1_9841 [Colletotrichum tanaceti]|uniref:Uncharacterized protein n=1 Tax=Colletotrichum tanaceti TaxID=1306861 RepID=A0A4U6XF83_9PEZI|nr:hypothetical protein CTA1_9841 [Colletotrichum tanaceti]
MRRQQGGGVIHRSHQTDHLVLGALHTARLSASDLPQLAHNRTGLAHGGKRLPLLARHVRLLLVSHASKQVAQVKNTEITV